MPESLQTSATSEAISQGSSGAVPTDAEILGTTDDTAEVTDAAVEQDVVTTDEVVADESVDTDAVEQEETVEQVEPPQQGPLTASPPKLYRQVMAKAMPEEKAFLQSLYDRAFNNEQALSSFATVGEAKEIAHMLPGGATQLKEMVERYSAVEQDDYEFLSGDPKMQEGPISRLYETNPDAVISGIPVTFGLLRQKNPEAYNRVQGETIAQLLSDERGMQMVFMDAQRAVSGKDGQAALAILQELTNWRGFDGLKNGHHQRPQDPRQSEFAKREQSVAEREQALLNTNIETFQSKGSERFGAEVGKLSEGVLDQIISSTPNVRITEQSKQDLAGKIAKATIQAISEDAAFVASQNRLVNPWGKQFNLDPATQDKLVQRVVNRARQAMPEVAKRVFSEWTGSIVAQNKARIQKKTTAASRKDISGGAVVGSAGKGRLTQAEANKMDPMAVLNDNRRAVR